MNMGGVIKGGLLAGLILNVGEGVFYGLLTADRWGEVVSAMGMEEGPAVMAYYVLGGFAIGILALWLYAAVRPRLGPGPGTAIRVGLLVWVLAWLWPMAPFALGGVVPGGLMLVSLLWGLVEVVLAVTAGAWLYSEHPKNSIPNA